MRSNSSLKVVCIHTTAAVENCVKHIKCTKYIYVHIFIYVSSRLREYNT